MKLPKNCENMDEIRGEIDALDREIIRLLGARFGYVKAAAKFKAGAASVRAPQRFASMLEARCAGAQQENLSPNAIEKMYRDLVEYFIAEEARHWQARAAKERREYSLLEKFEPPKRKDAKSGEKVEKHCEYSPLLFISPPFFAPLRLCGSNFRRCETPDR